MKLVGPLRFVRLVEVNCTLCAMRLVGCSVAHHHYDFKSRNIVPNAASEESDGGQERFPKVALRHSRKIGQKQTVYEQTGKVLRHGSLVTDSD